MRCAACMQPSLSLFVVLSIVFSSGLRASAQQSYGGAGSDCSSSTASSDSSGDVNVGYSCSAALPSCQTYAYFRAQQSLSDVAALFSSNVSAIATASSLSDSASLTSNQPLFIPVSCSCGSTLDYSVMNISYTIQPADTFSKIANSTYQGLTTCYGIEVFNPSASATSLVIGASLTVPLRCACPSQSQLDQGTNLLVTYPIVSGDVLSSIASGFGANLSLLQSANGLSQNSIIQVQSTILIPLAKKPDTPPSFHESDGSSPPTEAPPSGRKSSHVGTYVGIAVAACIAVLAVVLALFCFKRRIKQHDAIASSEVALMETSDTITSDKKSSSFFKQHEIDIDGINYKLPSYSKQDILAATNNFDASSHIKGSVYCGMLNNQCVAIKRVDGNVSNTIYIFKSLHHANLVSLVGTCLGTQESFLVYPYVGEGSLKDWLHEFPYDEHKSPPSHLSWFARVRIATDVANALEYLHEYTKPVLVHKNIASSNILVDGNFRGKLSNLGLAKSAEDMKGGIALTSHIEGKQGYLAPEYMNEGILSMKTDVFAFGIVLLEMLSGQQPILRDGADMHLPGKSAFLWESINSVLQADDGITKENLKQWVDPVLEGQFPLHCALKMSLLARQCVSQDPQTRPRVTYIASVLMEILETSQEWEAEGGNSGVMGR